MPLKTIRGPFAITAQQVQLQLQPVTIIAEAKAEDSDDGGEDENSNFNTNDRKADKETEEFWEEWHELFANMTLFLVRIAGVIVSSYIDKEKLVKAMLTGKKDIDGTYL